MSELTPPQISDIYGPNFPSTQERLNRAYLDPVVHVKFIDIKESPTEDRPALQAQLTTYLAAAHMLFPEESQIIHNSLEG